MFRYIHHQSLSANIHGRDFIVADLHGCFQQLKVALVAVEFDPRRDRLLSVGDLIDRGEDSFGCLKLLREDWFFAVQGNHENMMLGGLKAGPGSDPWRGWMQNGGDWYTKLNKQQLGVLKTLVPLVIKMPITAIVHTTFGKTIGLSHAQPPTFDWSKLNENYRLSGDELWRAMWSREVLKKNVDSTVTGVDITVHGHTIINKPKKIANMHFIDLGFYARKKVELIEVNEALFADNPFSNNDREPAANSQKVRVGRQETRV